ncbi:UNVERIFIED_CONTAM: hypothetical protein PYX00_005610 [Menopon gallinae]|uniref:Dynein heavy chain linker domain-containing protein n=1 Tax=Menopon gallinae TaxID=328185 RepID=A0AAW2HTJ9_9NEOP
MLKMHLEEAELEGEGGFLPEIEEFDSQEAAKVPEKEWPPLYQVLNPEDTLAEMELPIAYREPSLISKGRMPKFSPHLEEVPRTEIKDFLHPEEQWVVYETEPNIAFPVQAFKPRCYILHVVEPGKLPRKVFIERRRREYLSMNLEELLKEYGLTDDDLLPPTTSRLKNQFALFESSSFLPLEVFDDVGFDPCSISDWLELGKIQNVQHPIPAVAFIPVPVSRLKKLKIGKASMRYTNRSHRTKQVQNIRNRLKNWDVPVHYLWLDVAVMGYNYDTSKWHIVTLDGSQSKMWLPRIYVMFRAEDPKNFALRVLDAVQRRHQAEKLIKFNIYCDSMPLDGMPGLEEKTIQRIYKSVTRRGLVKAMDDKIDRLIEDAVYNHRRVLGQLSFVHVVERYPDMFSFIELPDSPSLPYRERGLITTGMLNYEEVRKNLNWWWLYVLDEAYLGMMNVVTACLKLNSMNFFSSNFGKHVTLEEFDSIQSGYTTNLIKYLRIEWVDIITTNVRMCLQDTGKGWFNIKEKNWKIYELSKLYRYMELIKFRMETSLKCLVESSTDLLVKLVEVPCLSCIDVPDENFVWGDDLINSPFKATGAPIFTLTLNLNNEDAYYSTPPEAFEDTLIKLYDNCIALSHTIQQVHPNLLVNLRFADLFLSSIGLSDPLVAGKRERLRLDIRKAVIPLKAYAREYRQHAPLFALNVNKFIADYGEENHTPQDIRDDIIVQMNEKAELTATIPSSIIIGPFLIHVEAVKKLLVDKREMIIERILSYFAGRLRKQIAELNREFVEIDTRMKERPTSIEGVFEIREWLETVPLMVKGHEESIKKLMQEYDILEQFQYSLSNEDFENKCIVMGWPRNINNTMEQMQETLEEETAKFYRNQLADESLFWERYESYILQVHSVMQISDMSKVHETAVEIRRLWKALKDSQEFGQLLNSRQKLFGVAITSFDLLLRLIRDFTPYKDLWLTASDWLKYKEIWMDNPLSNIDGESIDRVHGEMLKTMVKCRRIFSETPAYFQIATNVKNDMDDFRQYIPLIQALRSPGMKDRHWDKITSATEGAFKYNPNISFRECLGAGLMPIMDLVINVSETAKKEYSIEQTLDKMEREWETVDIEFTPYKETGTFIMKLSDDVIQMLDDHLVSTQQLSFSPFKGLFEKRIDEWEEKLRLVSDVMDQWTECQRTWMYLEPIFTSEDITEQLPFESKKFSTMERIWRRIMKAGSEMRRVMMYCPDKRLYEALKECNFLLEQVQKGLAEYLEAKRTVFPRLYFLSDDELLEILAEAKNPLAVQPHLRKCFENIYKLQFEKDLKITKMFSGEGEGVSLTETMYPTGGVEYWLLRVEEVMRTTVQVTLYRALMNLPMVDRNEWVLSWPGQIVIAGSQTYWTANVEDGIRENRLDQYFLVMLSQLDGLRNLVKGQVSRVERQILSALIVIEVHARDVTEKILKENVENVNDFEWISQLRYYWVNDQDLKVRAVNAGKF